MESDKCFGRDVSTNSNPPEKPSKRSGTDFFYEVWWPLTSWTIGLRPLHMWDVGRRARIQKGEHVLELGAGYPLWRIYSGRVGKEGLFIALDSNETISKRSKTITRFLNLDRNRPSEQITIADADKLPFQDNSIDVVIASNLTASHLAYEEAFRVLKPNGRLINANLDWDNESLLKKIGFVNVEKKKGTLFLFVPNIFCLASKPSPKDTLK